VNGLELLWWGPSWHGRTSNFFTLNDNNITKSTIQFIVCRPDSSSSVSFPVNCPRVSRMRLFFPRLFNLTSTVHFSGAARCCFSTTSHFNRYQLSPRKSQLVTSTMAPPMTTKAGKPLDKDLLESLLKRRLFFTPAFEIHAPVKGLFGT
jgi:hypothetical protein